MEELEVKIKVFWRKNLVLSKWMVEFDLNTNFSCTIRADQRRDNLAPFRVGNNSRKFIFIGTASLAVDSLLMLSSLPYVWPFLRLHVSFRVLL